MKAFSVVFSPAAAEDLTSIGDHIAGASSRSIADNFVERLIAYCEGLSRAPHRGTVRDENRPGLRMIGWRRTITIAFAVDDEARRVDIAGIFYRGRNAVGELTKRE
jgi:toxin ParE1/3/4